MAPYLIGWLAIGVLFGLLFPYRRDYPAHAIAGAASVVGIAAVLRRMGIRSSGTLALGAMVVFTMVSEPTVFGPEFDWVDISNTLAGLAVGAALVERFPPQRADTVTIVVASGAIIAFALWVRFVSSIGPTLL